MEAVYKVRIVYSKYGLIRFIGHLDTMNVMFSALRRAGLPLHYTEGFNPRVKASFSPPLPLGFSSEAEFLELSLSRKIKPEGLKDSLQGELPEGIVLKAVEEIPVGGKSLCGSIKSVEYLFNTGVSGVKNDQIGRRKNELLEKNGILSITVNEEGECAIVVEPGSGKGGSPREIAKALLDIDDDEVKKIEFTRKKFFFKL